MGFVVKVEVPLVAWRGRRAQPLAADIVRSKERRFDMKTKVAALALALFSVGIPSILAQGSSLEGTWKISFFENEQKVTLWLLDLEKQAGQLKGTLRALDGVPPSSLDKLEIKDGQLSFTVIVKNQSFHFEGDATPINGKVIAGSVATAGQLLPTVLERTMARNSFEIARELVTQSPNDPRIFEALPMLIKGAARAKASAKEVRAWVDAALKLGQRFGPRWQRENTLKVAELLARQEGLAELAVNTARAAEGLKGNLDFQLRTLEVLSTALTKLGKAEQARTVEARLDKIESQAHEEYSQSALPFKPAKFPGRKGASNRAVLVELFTGGQCPPCVAADLAFDAVEKSYKPADVVLLQYHLHIPGPDPLTNPDSEARQEYYRAFVEGTPTIIFNGKPEAPGGGGRSAAPEKFDEYVQVLKPLLEQPSSVQLEVAAVRQGPKINIRARVSDLSNPGPKIRLRLALVEDWVRYRGRNGLGYHSRIVRGFPGGAAGLALTKKDADHAVSVNIDELRQKLATYLDNFARNESPFPDAQRPLRLRRLHVVAFVQNDQNNEVLQAVEVPIREE